MSAQGVEERVTSQLTDWLTTMPQRVAQAWTGGGAPPFAAKTTGAERLAYFREKAFLPNGQPNEVGRRFLMDRYGNEGFVRVMRALHKQGEPLAPPLGGETLPEPAPPPAQEGGY